MTFTDNIMQLYIQINLYIIEVTSPKGKIDSEIALFMKIVITVSRTALPLYES